MEMLELAKSERMRFAERIAKQNSKEIPVAPVTSESARRSKCKMILSQGVESAGTHTTLVRGEAVMFAMTGTSSFLRDRKSFLLKMTLSIGGRGYAIDGCCFWETKTKVGPSGENYQGLQ